MINIIANQQVYAQENLLSFRKRLSRHKKLRRRPVPADLVWRIKQDPVSITRTRRRRSSPLAALKALFSRSAARPASPKLSSPKKARPPRFVRLALAARPAAGQASPRQAAAGQGSAEKGKAGRSRAFFEIFCGAGLFLAAALSFLVSFAIPDWESPSLVMLFRGPAFLDPGLAEPLEDNRSEQGLASYVGAGLLSFREAEEIPLDLTESFSWGTYTVRRGDTVSQIAADYHISLDAIIASNGIANVKRLREGETLRIPNMDGIPYTVKKGDNITKISAAMGVPKEAILDANDIQNDFIAQGTLLFIPGARMKREELKMAMGDLFIYPVRGRLTSPYGWRNDPISGVRRHHAAVDLAAPMGTPIKAAQDGKVSVVGINSTYGNFVILEHGGGYQTMYAHMSVVSVKQGASVIQGLKIGEVGSTGYSTGPHLHFAVYRNGRPLNPLEFLNQ
ncbi:MAG: M23 family metallopeptidase [Treponema sp.]|nr:M23 family metallopeptidase [Treponema sp.]